MADVYELLGVSRLSTLDEARAAFKDLAQIYHPDRYLTSPPAVRAEAERRMQELTEAFASLIALRRDGKAGVFSREDPSVALWWDTLERRRKEDGVRRERHHRWEDIERARIEREEYDRAAVEAQWRQTFGDIPTTSEKPTAPGLLSESVPEGKTKSLDQRIREAKGKGANVVLDPPARTVDVREESTGTAAGSTRSVSRGKKAR